MLNRAIVIESAGHLAIQNGQLLFKPREPEGQARIVPSEDLGFLIIEHGAVTLTLQVLSRLTAHGVAIVICDDSHMPCAVVHPVDGHSTHAEVLRSQMAMAAPAAKRLWQQLIKAKIINQASVLASRKRDGVQQLERLAREVRSGDPNNREAVAAKIYWENLFFRQGFTRDPDGDGPNPLLNYGYAILRAAVARALTGSGLHCALGLHHRNRYNAFALADDVMEPYRPFVDSTVVQMAEISGQTVLNKDSKRSLIAVLTADTLLDDQRRPLMNALSSTTASLARVMAGEGKALVLPKVP
jgi:CRISPR-associated protein Cas1